ncbi:MAG TPA: magnesium transporter [Gammaproteobacteria bacterium]|nr:magnesium transporter [Gammaproteobacteria bacterium]
MSETATQTKVSTRLGELRAALESGTLRHVRRMLNSMHPAEIASLLESLPPPEREIVWELVDPDDDGEVLLHVNDEVRSGLIRGMDAEELLAATDGLEIDDLADLFADLPETVTRQLLRSMDQQNRERLQAVLSYPEDTAGGLMNVDTVTVRPDVTLDVVLRYLRMRDDMPQDTDTLFVVNRYGRLLGTLRITKLLTSDPDLTVADVMDRDVEGIPADTPAAEVAKLFEDRDLVSAPVVDEKGVLLGRITIDDVVDVIREQADHTVLSLSGLDEEEDIFAGVWRTVRNRSHWIAINLVTAFIASRVIGLFEGSIERLVALASLMPIIAGIGGNTGNQTVTLIVRALALGRISRENARELFLREIGVSLVNGVIWGSLLGVVTFALYGNPALGVVMMAAMVLNLLLAACAGVFIPLIRQRLGRDPAQGSSVMITAITDTGGFFIFLGLATLFLL